MSKKDLYYGNNCGTKVDGEERNFPFVMYFLVLVFYKFYKFLA